MNQAAFTARRLSPRSPSTFLVLETDDIYNEHPFIYAILIPPANTILIIDTGCGGLTKKPDVKIKSLRKFLEKVGVEDNHGRPLNEGGTMRYILVLSHCHYDHICVEDFARDSTILASDHSPSFLSPANLPAHSLCKFLNIPTPAYTPTLVEHTHPLVSPNAGLIALHTPGHTPDSLSVWDQNDRMLYVGDTLYETEPIIFPNEGSIVTWLKTVDYLIAFVKSHSREDVPEVLISCGHATAARPGLELLVSTKRFMRDVIKGDEPVRARFEKRGEVHVEYRQQGGRYSLICPERLVVDARVRHDR